ncbi:MAG: amidase [Steroidobacteraceae bacterium]
MNLSRRDLLLATGLLPVQSAFAARAGTSRTAVTGTGNDIVSLDALGLSRAIRARDISCVEVMTAYLRQIEAFNPQFNAIVNLRSQDELLAEAAIRDRELAAGVWRGWMHGFPHAVKDLANVRGLATTFGSPLFVDNIAAADSILVERIRSSGAIFIGKTNVPEFGMGSQSYNPVFGATRCAYDPTRTAGGSSGGAAAALALRMVPVADGSDMMGSLRNPAAYNNVIGLRPTFGRVPADAANFQQQLGCSGPMARTIPELASLLATIAGFDARDPGSLGEDPAPFAGSLTSEPRGLRIGWLGDYDGYLAMEAGVLEQCDKALQVFANLDCVVEPLSIGFDMADLWQCWLKLRHWTMGSRVLALYQDPQKRLLLKPEAVWEVEGSLSLTAATIAQAMATRSRWYQHLHKLFQRYDFLVLPSAQVFPFAVTQHWPQEIAGRRMDTYHRWMEVVIGGTLAGCPVLNLPAGFNTAGLPMGIQVMAAGRRELALLRQGAAYEAAAQHLIGHAPPALGAKGS